MKKRAWVILLAGLMAGILSIALLPERMLFQPHTGRADAAGSSDGTRWACPMMDYIGNRPGNCPVCGMKMQPVTAGELSREQQNRMGLELTTIQDGPAVVSIRAMGTADYDHRFTQVFLPRVAGRIVKRYPATFGCCQTIEAGAPVVELYSAEVLSAQGELASALALGDRNLVQALRQRFERWNLLEVADALEAGGGVQENITLRVPFAGQVLLDDMEEVNEMLEVGREVMPDTPILRLVNPDKRVITLRIPESRTAFIREGQPVTLSGDLSGPLPDATIGRLSNEINPATRTREAQVYLTDTNHLLRPGEVVSARIQGALDSKLQPADPAHPADFPLIPKTAVLSTGIRHVAWRVVERKENGHLRFAPAALELGPRIEDANGNDHYIVRAGLKTGDEVATQGAFLIDSQAQLAGTPSLLNPHGATAETTHQH